jgi:hypothetical protein
MVTIAELRRCVAREYRRILRPPWEVPAILLTNATVMILAWFLLPARAHDFLFSLNGPLAFPIILAAWMLADTPATNVMGANTSTALSVVADRSAYWHWLVARCVVLGSLVGVPSAVAVIIVGAGGYTWLEIGWAAVIVLLLPVGVLPIAAWLGIIFPYHPRSLRWRWQHRRAWRMNLRWVALVLAPFGYVPLVGGLIMLPAVALAKALRVSGQRLTDVQFGIAAAVACATMGVAAALGIAGARRLIGVRQDRLAAYLSSSASG